MGGQIDQLLNRLKLREIKSDKFAYAYENEHIKFARTKDSSAIHFDEEVRALPMELLMLIMLLEADYNETDTIEEIELDDGYDGTEIKYMPDGYFEYIDTSTIFEEVKKKRIVFNTVKPVSVYTDGSYGEKGEHKIVTYAYAIVRGGEIIHEHVGRSTFGVSARNVAGEIHGALEGINKAVSMGYNQITVFHDYEGLRSWANDEWKAKTDISKRYKYEIGKHKVNGIDIRFIKVKAHSGNAFNEHVDDLANKHMKRLRNTL